VRREQGFTLVEMLVAMFVLAIGIVATIGVFGSSKGVSVVAQRHEAAVHQGQREIERLRSLTYSQLGLTALPAVADRLESDPTKIGYYNGSSFVAKTGSAAEQLAVLDAGHASYAVDPTPATFTVGVAGISGKVYRYVTYRPENCGTDGAGQELCPGNEDTKRVTVAVTMNSTGGRPGLQRPVWLSSVVINPESEPYEQ
jgi:prepilin-type N-terminal cleavage/methylation domain-containing protein